MLQGLRVEVAGAQVLHGQGQALAIVDLAVGAEAAERERQRYSAVVQSLTRATLARGCRAGCACSTARQRATALSERFERGEPGVDIADVMVSIQKANVSFQAATQVRNRLVSAYQDIMNMPL